MQKVKLNTPQNVRFLGRVDFPVCEAFYSIQAEGPSVGRAAFFLRTTKCPIFCRWCDSKYTWKEKGKVIEELYVPEVCKLIVVTGGEPLYYKEEISQFIQKHGGCFRFEIETSGAFGPLQKGTNFSVRHIVSPKFKNQAKNWKLSHKYIKDFAERPDTYFKFVLGTESDKKEIVELIKKYDLVNGGIPNRIFIMPEGRTNEEIVCKRDLVVDFCKEYGFIYSPRIQVQLWGMKRGV